MKFRIALLLSGLCGYSLAFGSTFCVTSVDELTSALAAAQQDQTASHEIRIHTGHYMTPAGGWRIDIDVRGITIVGGYDNPDCTSQSSDASLTVLDGHQSARPLTIDTSFAFQQTPVARDIVIRGLTFANGSGDRAGGLKVSDAGPITTANVLIERNIFRNNAATVYAQDNSGGALLVATDGPDFSGSVFLTVRGNLFSGNRAPDGAAALLFSNNSIDVSNNTVTANQSFDTSLSVRSTFTTFTLSGINYSNNIFWANNPDSLADTFDLRADSTVRSNLAADLFNNDLQAVHGTPRTDQDNRAVDPGFIDSTQGDFHVAKTSMMVDVGIDDPEGGVAPIDLDGTTRVLGAHVDIGAYESNPDTVFQDGFDGTSPF